MNLINPLLNVLLFARPKEKLQALKEEPRNLEGFQKIYMVKSSSAIGEIDSKDPITEDKFST